MRPSPVGPASGSGSNDSMKRQPLLTLNLFPFAFLGLCAVLFYAPYLRGLFFGPELLPTQMAVAGVFALVAWQKLINRDASFLSGPVDYATLGLVAAYLVSLTVAVDLRGAVGEVLKVASYFMVYWATSRALAGYRGLDRFLSVLFASAVGVALVGVAAVAGLFRYPGALHAGSMMSTLQYENALGGYMLVMNIVGLTLWCKRERVIPRSAYAVGSYLILVMILATRSRGSWVLYPLAFLLLLLGMPRRYVWRAVYDFFLALGVGLVASRSFLPHVAAGGGELRALLPLAAGAAAMVMGQVLHRLVVWVLDRYRVSMKTRNVLALGGVFYVILVFAFYVSYASSTVPAISVKLVPKTVITTGRTMKADDSSLIGRIFASRDALKIVKDFPILGTGGGGWNALYHRYQSTLYWTTEVHNHFFQVWVETGTLGFLAFLGIWAGMIYTLYRFAKRGPPEHARLLVWGAGVAALAQGAHSFMDFDLSLPALAMILWALFGAVAAGEGIALAQEGTGGAGTFRRFGGGVARAGRERGPGGGSSVPPWVRLLAFGLLTTLGAAAVFATSWSLYRAGKLGAAGARAMINQDLSAAERYFAAAHRLDPFSGSYSGDLAQVYTALGVIEKDPGKFELARQYAQKAVRVQPYNQRVRAALVNAYFLQGDVDRSVGEAEAVLNINPLDRGAYENLGRAYITAARYHLARGDKPSATGYIYKALAIPGAIQAKLASLSARSARRWAGPRLEVSPAVRLVAGQAMYLSGDYRGALKELEAAAASKPLKPVALLWQAASYARLGFEEKAEEIAEGLIEANPELDSEYRGIRSLPTP